MSEEVCKRGFLISNGNCCSQCYWEKKKQEPEGHTTTGVKVNLYKGYVDMMIRVWEDMDKESIELKRKFVVAKKALELIGSQCGLPDSGDACRAILKTQSKALKEIE